MQVFPRLFVSAHSLLHHEKSSRNSIVSIIMNTTRQPRKRKRE